MTRFLVIQPDDSDPVGWLGERWTEQGVELDIVRPYAGEPVPESCDADALVVLGGDMGASDDQAHPWLADVRRLQADTVAAGTPTLGICLGHQLLSVALGGVVHRNPHGRTLGAVAVTLTESGAADPFVGGVDGREVVHYNDDVVTTLPEGSVPLATSPDGTVQAVRHAPGVWGIQFHPEASTEIFGAWMEHDEPGPDKSEGERYLAEVAAAREAMRATADALADAFAAAVTSAVSPVSAVSAVSPPT